MIGVITKPGEEQIAAEFFELFKTPWEFYAPGHDYEIILATCTQIPLGMNAKTIAIYSSRQDAGSASSTTINSGSSGAWVTWQGVEFPVYRSAATFGHVGKPIVHVKGSADVVGFRPESSSGLVRIGYDLFEEIGFLLSHGQPAQNAHLPTLEIHIALLRSIMIEAGVSFVEVPPVPAGFDFMACLTHDVDFIGIRDHKGDRTFWGFFFRATVGSFLKAYRGRIPWSRCWQNWKAVLSLPLVLLGIEDDFWLEFDRYLDIEKGLGSTFYFIPFKGRPGRNAPPYRAAPYNLKNVQNTVRSLVEAGCEIGLHGIDAWQDANSGQMELDRIREVSGKADAGARMHWLYFDKFSPQKLEQAGIKYDSTFGYNDAVGFRAGTSQTFRPLGAQSLLELPLSIQDTALFYPDRMNLTEAEALDSCKQLVQFSLLFGGALTINWHTRSLSPERLWAEFYAQLLQLISSHRVWFATASQITEWFRKRREISFDIVAAGQGKTQLKLNGSGGGSLPPFLLRFYEAQPGARNEVIGSFLNPTYSDRVIDHQMELQIS